MTTKTYFEFDAADEIINILKGRESDKTPEPEPITSYKEEVSTLAATDWADYLTGQMRMVPFSELFWTPVHMPDHLVPQFKGFECEEVPAIYVPPVKQFEELSLNFSLKHKPNMVGATGCGKTLMYEYYAASTGRPYLRIEHNVELDKATVFGQTHITEGDTDFVMGVLPLSMELPTLVVLDELSRATGYSNMIYQRMLDRRELAMPELKGSRNAIITPDEYWLVAASDNTKGDGEDMDKYPMSNVQDGSFINRWDCVIEVDYLSESQERTLIANLYPDINVDDGKKLAQFSALVHAGYKKGNINTAFSPRNLATICKYLEAGIPVVQAISMNYTTRCPESEQPFVSETVRAVFG